MDPLEFLKIVGIFFLSVFKYVFGLFSAVNSGLGFWTSILTNIVGGAVGILLFIYFGEWITLKYYAWKYKKNKYKRFSWWNKFLVKIKQKVGLKGIAIISPIILTIPVGVMLSLQLTANKKKIFTYIFTSMVFWSAVFYLVEYLWKGN